MSSTMEQLEAMMNEGKLVDALAIIEESQKLEKWQELYSTHLILAEAYCKLFKDKSESGLGVDTISVRQKLETLTE